jgi:hypothetical protein
MLSADYSKARDLLRDLGEATDIGCSQNYNVRNGSSAAITLKHSARH